MEQSEKSPATNTPRVVIAGSLDIDALRRLAHDFARQHGPFTLHCDGYSATDTDVEHGTLEHIDTSIDPWPASGRKAGPLDLYAIMSTVSKDAVIFVYGPLTFVQTAVDAADCYGVPRTNLKVQRLDNVLARTEDHAFDVALARSARTVHVARDVTMLDALLAAGVDVRRGCRDGHCGQCVVDVLQGDVDHRDIALNDVDRSLFGCMCPCVSRSKGTRLVIDL